MVKWLRDIFTNLLANLLFLLGVGVAIVVSGWFADLAIYQILLLILGVFVLVFLGINQVSTSRERHEKKLSKYSDEELETTIRQWLDIPAFSFKRQDPESSLYFKFLITDDAGRYVTIFRNKKMPRIIEVSSEVEFDLINESDWQKLSDRLSLEMARFGVEFRLFSVSNNSKRIRVSTAVNIEDSLTGFYFRERIVFVLRAFVLIQIVYASFCRELDTIQQASDKEGH